jgi:hypothetical protein
MRRFIDDESGMTMGLTVIMLLLIGVMGAGLLTFVSRDLNSVLQANQGGQAQEMADAGLSAAKRHLSIMDALPSHYETANTADNSPWYDNAADNESGNSGRTLTFNGNEVLVSIRYLDVSTTEAEARDPDNAPEVLPTYFRVVDGVTEVDTCDDVDPVDGTDDDTNTDPDNLDPDACNYENGRNYFRVTVRGGTGDAIRVVQAIFKTENFGSVPLSYYASRDIEIDGGADIENMSIFANRHIRGLRPENIRGVDHSYGDWANLPGNAGPNEFNATPRIHVPAGGTPVIHAGAAAPGTITYSGNADNTSEKAGTGNVTDPLCLTPSLVPVPNNLNCQRYGYRDYDADTDQAPFNVAPKGPRPEFAVNDWGDKANQPSTKMTYPFAPPNPTEDAQAMAVLKERAQLQGLYFRPAPGSTFNIDTPPYPASSNLQNTVMFVEFADGTDDSPIYGAKGLAEYRAQSSDADNLVKGIIVVINGDLKINQSADDFQGAMIVRDPIEAGNATDNTSITCTDNGAVMDYCSSGQVRVEGWINVQSDISLAGTADGFLPSEMSTGLSSLVKVSQWSWRECYNTTCS